MINFLIFSLKKLHNNSKCIIFATENRRKGTQFFQNNQIKMKKNDERFKNFIQIVSKDDKPSVKKAILKCCKVTKSCYYLWFNGGATPSLRRREVINGIAFKYNYPKVYEYAKGYNYQKKLELC